ncbi:hypothetical protein F4X88_07220 [Candidatus Poribacteria bacterium]|nr:hypothetical protein [Candidatus Poribacteria bacterium]
MITFHGSGYREISKQLGVTPTTLISWAKREEWKSLKKTSCTETIAGA